MIPPEGVQSILQWVISCLEILILNYLSWRMNTFLSSLECKAGFFSQWRIWLFSLNNLFITTESRPALRLLQNPNLKISVPKVTEVKRSPSYLINDNINYELVFIFKPSFFIYKMLSFYFNHFEQESTKLQINTQFFLSWRWNREGEWSGGSTHSETRLKKFMNI